MAYINTNVSTMAMPSGMNRMGQFPLDMSSIWYDEASLINYAKTGATAYVGQVLTLVDATNKNATVYVIENEAGDLKPVGTIPVGDGNTISINEDGKITLANIEDKQEGTYNAVLVDGVLTWVAPDNTTIDDINTTIGKLEKDIADEINRAKAAEADLQEAIEAIDFVNDEELANAIKDFVTNAALATELAKKLDVETYNVDKKALDNKDIELANAIAEAKKAADEAQATIDEFLTGEGLDPDVIETLKEIQEELKNLADTTELLNTIDGKADKVTGAVAGNFAGLDTNGNLIDSGSKASDFATPEDVEAVDNKFADYTSTADLETLLTAKQDTIPENTYDAYGAAATAKSEAIADADTKLADKANAADVYTIAQADKAIADALAKATGGESAADVALALDNYKKALNLEVYGNEDGTGDSRIDTLEAIGAEANVIDAVVNSATAKITATTNGKTVTIDDAALVALIDEAKEQADAGVANAQKAQSDVDALAIAVGKNSDDIADHLTRIITLENANTAHTAEYNALSEIVSGHTEAIASLAKQGDLADALAKISANETAIKTLNETTIPGLENLIDTKANANDVYTINAIDALLSEVQTTVEGKITDLANGAVKDNTDNIAIIMGSGEGSIAAAVAAEKARAEGIEGALDARLGTVENFFKAVEEPDEVIDTLAEIVKYIESDKSGATALLERVDGLADRITANETAIGTTLPGAISSALVEAKAYTDTEIAKIPVADEKTIVVNDGKLSVGQVSTDNLVQGTMTLILNGGSANVETAAE